jgi:hypothetical protein
MVQLLLSLNGSAFLGKRSAVHLDGVAVPVAVLAVLVTGYRPIASVALPVLNVAVPLVGFNISVVGKLFL